MQYTKEAGIPFPDTFTHKKGLSALMRTLAIGDSFLIEMEKRTMAATIAGRVKIKIVTKTISPTEVRVWRTE